MIEDKNNSSNNKPFDFCSNYVGIRTQLHNIFFKNIIYIQRQTKLLDGSPTVVHEMEPTCMVMVERHVAFWLTQQPN